MTCLHVRKNFPLMKQPFLRIAPRAAFGILCLSGVLCSSLGADAAAPNLLGGGSWALLSPPGSAHMNGKPAGPSLGVTVVKPAVLYYQIQLTHDITAGAPAGTRLRYQFWAKSATRSTFHAVIEKRTAPYTHFVDQQITLSPVWKEYAFSTPALAASKPRAMAARLQVGQQAGAFDFKDLTVAAIPR